MIKKPSIIITLIGRTGTKYFQLLFKEILPEATSIHEPDIFTTVELLEYGEDVRHLFKQIQVTGYKN